MQKAPYPRSASLPGMLGYGLGECANSLVMNGLFGFAMLYYTEALKLSPALAGIAMSVSVFWEAVTDPVMGYVSDRTRHRYGRRHPWMLAGGLLMALCFYFLWAVPVALHGRALPLFAYLVTLNLLLRTGLTLFFIPYLALGFELSQDYEGRSKIQAVRQVMNMAANFAGPALAWSVFFRDSVGPDGAKILGTDVPQNFVHMGAALSAWVARRLDKKGAVLVGGAVSVLCNGMLAALFLTGWVPTGTLTALILFVAFHAAFWLGNGILLPTCTAMMADVAELYRRRSGVNKDGAYSAVFSLSMRLAISFALMASGWTLSLIGFSADAAQGSHTAQTVWRLGAAMFLAGPVMCLLALAAVTRCPLNRELVTKK